MNKLTHDLLVRLFEDDPYKDISKFKREMKLSMIRRIL